MNRIRAVVALLAGVPLALGIGAGTATAAPPVAPPLSEAAPLSSAPALPGSPLGWGFDNGVTLVAISCAQTTLRTAWSMPLIQRPVHGGGVAGYSVSVPIINTAATGPVEWVAYGANQTTGPLIRSGCLSSPVAQKYLNWGDPVIGARANPSAPPVGAQLSILPGEPAPPTAATTTPEPTTAAATAPAAAAPVNTAPAAPAYTGTPDSSAQSSQPAPDSGGGTPWGAILFGILTLLFATVSRYTSHRVRREETLEKIPLPGHLYGGAAALAGLISASSAPASIGGFLGAAMLAVVVGLALSAQRAAHGGYRISVVALIKTARTEWPAAGSGAAVGFITGYVAGSGVASPATLYGILAGAAIGVGAAHLRQTRERVAGWMVDAALVADVLGVPEKAITETGEVAFSTTADGGFIVDTLNQNARSHLDGIEDRCAQVAPYLMITRADRMRVEAGPVDATTAAHREAMTGSGGLVGGAHSGADPWTGGAPPPAPDNGSVNMHKPGTGTTPDVIDLSAGWD